MAPGFTSPGLFFIGTVVPKEMWFLKRVFEGARGAGYTTFVEPASGAFAMSGLARQVGKYGKVYVLESSGERADRLARQLRTARVTNAEVLSGDPARLELPDSTFDLALCVHSLADQPRRQRTLWELQRVLRPRGHLSVRESLRPGRYLRRGTLKSEASAVGLVCREEHGTPLAYTANFRKPA